MDFAKTVLAENWPEWQIVEQIGQGTFGKVYKIKREYLGDREQFSALKVISIPSNESKPSFAFSTGSLDNSRDYYKSLVTSIVREIELMAKVKGHTNIVSYEDHKVIDGGEAGWTILIRMELLTPLSEYIGDRFITSEEAAKIGVDICNALEVCAQLKIIHRDVKAENIFVSETGDFKLGDFGTARISERTLDFGTMAGTYPYMAPEMIKQKPYSSSVDIYSLGILLYKLLNKNRLPFYPSYPSEILHDDVQKAFQKRLTGEFPNAPCDADKRLSDIVLKACAFDAKDRFSTAADMKTALMNLYQAKNPPIKIKPKKKPKSKRFAAVFACIAVIIAVSAAIAAFLKDANTIKLKGENLTDGIFIYDDYNIEVHIKGVTACPESIVIPSQIKGKPVTSIASKAFANQKMKAITISDGIFSIGDHAFINCALLEEISLPKTHTYISDSAFADCVSLKTLTLPDVALDTKAFIGCTKLKNVISESAYVFSKDVFNNTPYLKNRKMMFEYYRRACSRNESGEYVLYDMNSDGIEELILKIGADADIYEIYSFTYSCNEIYENGSEAEVEALALPVGTFYKNYDYLCTADGKNGFFGYKNTDGYEEIDLITFEHESVTVTTFKDTTYVGSGELPGQIIKFSAEITNTEPLKEKVFELIDY